MIESANSTQQFPDYFSSHPPKIRFSHKLTYKCKNISGITPSLDYPNLLGYWNSGENASTKTSHTCQIK